MDNYGIATGDLFQRVGKADSFIVHCQFSIVNSQNLVNQPGNVPG